MSTTQYGTKEYLQEKLKDIDTFYVSYLNKSGSEMMLWYVDKDSGKLDKVWISPSVDPETYEIKKFKDDQKPSVWQKSRSKVWHYCFVCGGGGYSKKHHALTSLYYWLGLDVEKVREIEALN